MVSSNLIDTNNIILYALGLLGHDTKLIKLTQASYDISHHVVLCYSKL